MGELHQEFKRALLRIGDADAARAHPRQQPRGAVLALVPLVHAREHLVTVMDCEHRPIGDDRQLAVGDDRSDLDDDVGVGLQARHLEVDPYQVIAAGHVYDVGREEPNQRVNSVISVADTAGGPEK